MRGWSFPLGRWMGVELRIHTFFILLLGICMAYTESVHLTMLRGVGLWLVLLGAVAVREVARMLVAAYHGLQLRNILLLPIGGLVAYANAESADAWKRIPRHLRLSMKPRRPVFAFRNGLSITMNDRA